MYKPRARFQRWIFAAAFAKFKLKVRILGVWVKLRHVRGAKALIDKARKFLLKYYFDRADRAVSVLAHDDFGVLFELIRDEIKQVLIALGVRLFLGFFLLLLAVNLVAVDEKYHISILLDGA